MSEQDTLKTVIKIAGACEDWLSEYCHEHEGNDPETDWMLRLYLLEGDICYMENYYKEKYADSLTSL